MLTVVIPWRPQPTRLEALDAVTSWYHRELGDVDIRLVDSRDEVFNLAQCRNLGIEESDPDDVVMAAKVGKSVAALEALKADSVAKKGAKFSKTTKAALAAHHDALGKAAALVGECHKAFKDTMQEALAQEDDPAAHKDDDGVAMADKGGDVAKVAADLEIEKSARLAAEDVAGQAGEALKKVMGERDTLAADLAKANAELLRRPKGAILAIEKGADGGTAKVDEPIPANATPEQRAAAEIKKLHRSGGTLITRL